MIWLYTFALIFYVVVLVLAYMLDNRGWLNGRIYGVINNHVSDRIIYIDSLSRCKIGGNKNEWW